MSLKEAFIDGVKIAGQQELSAYHMNFDRVQNNYNGTVGADDKSEIGTYSDGAYSWVAACVNAKMMDISNTGLYFIDKNDKVIDWDRVDERVTTPINLGYAKNSFWTMLAIAGAREDLSGNDIWVIDEEANLYTQKMGIQSRFCIVPAGSWRLKKSGDDKGIDYYQVTWGNGEQKTYSPDKVIHFKRNAIIDPFIGIGLIASARVTVENEKVSTEYINRFFIKDGTPKIIYKDKGATNIDTARSRADLVRAEYKKGAYKDGIMYAFGDVDISPFSVSTQDLQYIEARKLNREAIISIMESTPAVLGLEGESGNRDISSNSTINYYKKVNSRLDHLVEIINDQWVRKFYKNLEVRLTYTPYPTGNMADISKAIEIGMQSRNDGNKQMGYAYDANNQAMNAKYISRGLAKIEDIYDGNIYGMLSGQIENQKKSIEHDLY